jgi:hypothetical protein
MAIERGEYPPGVDPCRAEVFSIGLTILSSGILHDCSDIYSQGPSRTISESLLASHLSQLKSKYTPYFFDMVAKMLVVEPSQRRRASQIYSELCPFEKEILELEEFQRPTPLQEYHLQPKTITGGGRTFGCSLPPTVYPMGNDGIRWDLREAGTASVMTSGNYSTLGTVKYNTREQ